MFSSVLRTSSAEVLMKSSPFLGFFGASEQVMKREKIHFRPSWSMICFTASGESEAKFLRVSTQMRLSVFYFSISWKIIKDTCVSKNFFWASSLTSLSSEPKRKFIESNKFTKASCSSSVSIYLPCAYK